MIMSPLLFRVTAGVPSRRSPRTWVLGLIAALAVSLAGAQGDPNGQAIQPLGKSSLNWSTGTIKVPGFGFVTVASHPREVQRKVKARQAAIADANRNLAEAVNGVQITSKTTVKDLITQNDRVVAYIRTFITGGRIVSETYREENGQTMCEVVMEAPLAGPGGFSTTILPFVAPQIIDEMKAKAVVPAATAMTGAPVDKDILQAIAKALIDMPLKGRDVTYKPLTGSDQLTKPMPGQSATPTPASAAAATPAPRVDTGDPVTGVLFDARAQGYSWNMFPAVRTEGQKSIYDVSVATQPDTGFFTPFAFSPKQGAENERTKLNPLIIPAKAIDGETIVISNEDGDKLMQLNASAKILENARVLIVIDPPPAPPAS